MLTPLSSLHRRESVDNLPTIGNRNNDMTEAVLYERQAGQGVQSPSLLLRGGNPSFCLIKTFLSWKETISRLDGWNPYKERNMKDLADIAKEKKENDLPRDPDKQFK
ncbi:hypothetical protein VP01_3306g1 [Puccinia sorghi]|uniref:Uncharacterized protein n=1 Tax=Puccinia sorghi TaxID=27349 RepID=A0A0L6UY88_9BASI|nr:hypothetical protein VP01_3306g1 [Puccinia sorghi]